MTVGGCGGVIAKKYSRTGLLIDAVSCIGLASNPMEAMQISKYDI